MKNPGIALLIALPMLILSNAAMFAKTITILKEDGGPMGYYHILEWHNNTDDILTCSDPGEQSCTWLMPPEGRLIGYAEHELANGNLTGMYTLIENRTRYTVTWTGTSSTNCRIQEKQEPVGSVQ